MTLEDFFREEMGKLGTPKEKIEASLLKARALYGVGWEMSPEELKESQFLVNMLKLMRVMPGGREKLKELKQVLEERLTKTPRSN